MEHPKPIKEISISLGYNCNNWCIFCTNIRKQKIVKPLATGYLKNYVGS